MGEAVSPSYWDTPGEMKPPRKLTTDPSLPQEAVLTEHTKFGYKQHLEGAVLYLINDFCRCSQTLAALLVSCRELLATLAAS